MVDDLKQQLERAEAARAQAENHLAELRRMQKAVGQPTEVAFCHTLSLQRVVADSRSQDCGVLELLYHTASVSSVLQCVTLQGRRFTAEEVFSELEMRNKQVEELEAKAAVHASELTHARLERDWAKDEQRRAEEALAQSKTRKV